MAGGSFGRNNADPIPPPRYTLGGVTALSRDATGTLTMTGCYSGTRRSLASEPLTTGECAAARGLDNVPYNVQITPDGKHVYFGVGPFDTPWRGSGLALFRVVAGQRAGARPGRARRRRRRRGQGGHGERRLQARAALPGGPGDDDHYTTFDETAKAGADYTRAHGTATIAQGQTTATVNVPITQDTTPEQPETFGLRITAADGAVLTEPEATASITDDDGRPPPPVLSIGAAEVVEGATAPCCGSRSRGRPRTRRTSRA